MYKVKGMAGDTAENSAGGMSHEKARAMQRPGLFCHVYQYDVSALRMQPRSGVPF